MVRRWGDFVGVYKGRLTDQIVYRVFQFTSAVASVEHRYCRKLLKNVPYKSLPTIHQYCNYVCRVNKIQVTHTDQRTRKQQRVLVIQQDF